ncbi:transglutaminase domain-containing protein [Pseudofulvibacter geojedonensis]|uniref:Transglutaminase domain-containing protein n=1 Tax=Pseudofulvibacter geojedonensis TaxID=1123758 RepID=A0ABW3I0Z0_9FLAO
MGKRILFVAFLTVITIANAQDYKFGRVSKEELNEKKCSIDSSANAAILYSKLRITYNYGQDEGFYKNIEVFKRIKIYDKEGFDWAKESVLLYNKSGKTRESIAGLKAVSYNLVNGSVEKSKMTKSDIFEENKNKYWKQVKFALPNIKEGSVLEYKYNIKSPFVSTIDDIELQAEIPIMLSDVRINIPEYFTYKIHNNIKSGLTPEIIETFQPRTVLVKWEGLPQQGGYIPKYEKNLEFNDIIYTVSMKDTQGMPIEPYTSNIDNFKSKLSFELLAFKSFNNQIKNYSVDWDTVVKVIYGNDSFGAQLSKESYFKKEIDALLLGVSTKQDKINKIFSFVKSKVKWNDFIGVYTSEGVKKAYNEGVGNVAEINLMLTAMLRYAGISANPILVSTKSNGVPLFPTRKGFNYVICGVEVQGEVLLLDATQPYASINNLPNRALNWQGRIIREHGSSTWVNLYPKKNSVNTSMIAAELNPDMEIVGKLRSQKTDYLAFYYRKKNTEANTESLMNKIKKNKDIEVSNLEVSNVKELSKPILQSYDFVFEEGVEEIGNEIYIDPLLFLAEKENVFNQEKRRYPIDFKYPITDKTIVNLKIPNGYKIKSYPKSEKAVMVENLGAYSYLVRANGNNIQVSQELKINFPIIPASYYDGLRDTYKKMIEKNSEKIVLEKI